MSVLYRIKLGVAGIPVLGPLARRLYGFLLLPVRFARASRTELPRINRDLADLADRLTRLEVEFRKLDDRFDDFMRRSQRTIEESISRTVDRVDTRMTGLEHRFGDLVDKGEHEWGASRRSYTELAHRLSLLLEDVRRDLNLSGSLRDDTKAAMAASPDPLFSTFYATFEDRFRGSREVIRKRVAAFLPDAREVVEATGGKGPVVDLGCGRGEWLEVLTHAGIGCLGIDSNEAQLAGARAHGLPVLNADALTWLKEQPPASVPMITAFHLIEHLPFPVLMQFVAETLRVLMPGGMALFETPNPENLIVGAWRFHLDPTHVKPLPPELTAYLLEAVGFVPVIVRPLHPDPAGDRFLRDGTLPTDVTKLLFGPADYAVLARKPGI